MISSYPTKGCGVSEYTERLIDGLSKKRFKIYSERVYAHESLISSAITWLKILNKIRRLEPNIVHIQYTPTIVGIFFPLFLVIVSILKISRKIKIAKIVITAHEKPSVYLEHIKIKWLKFLFKVYENLIYILSDVILVHTIEHKKEIHIFYRLGDKCKIVDYPVQTESTRNLSIELTSQEKIAKGTFNITYFGVIRPSRGLDILIKAFKIASSYNANLRLIIAGKIPKKFRKYYSDLQNLVNEPRIKERIVFKGFIPENEIPSLFKNSDVIVLPYRKSTQSEVLHQAIMYKRPVIVTNIGGISDMVKRFKIGEICNVDDIECLASKIMLLSENKKINVRYMSNMRHVIEIKSIEKVCEEYCKKIY